MGEILNLAEAHPRTKYKVKPVASGYHFEFLCGIEVRISRISEARSAGTTSGEGLFISKLPGTPTHLYQARINLTSSSSKASLAKELHKRLEAEWWQELLECVCFETLRLHREGEPLQWISTSDEITRPEYLLHPLLIRNQPSVVFGLGGTAKSLFGLTIGLVAQLPIQNNPLRMRTLNKSTSVLYLDYEADDNEYGWRLKCLMKAMEIDTMIAYRRQIVPLCDDIERVQELVTETGAELVIIDSLGPACGGVDLSTSEPAIRFNAALRTLKVASLSIAHTSKDQLSKEKTILGSVFFTNLARSVWEVKKKQEHGEDHIEIGLYHRKCNNSKLFNPMGFTIDFGSEDSVTIRRDDTNEVVQENMSQPDRIVQCLVDCGAMTVKEIAEETGLDSEKIGPILTRLKGKKVTQLGDKRWGALIKDSYLKEL